MKSSTPQIGISFPKDLLAFVDQARGQKARSAFVRDAALSAAAAALGQPAPAYPQGPGRKSPLATAAAAVGMSVKEYMRACALEKAGVVPLTPKPSAV